MGGTTAMSSSPTPSGTKTRATVLQSTNPYLLTLEISATGNSLPVTTTRQPEEAPPPDNLSGFTPSSPDKFVTTDFSRAPTRVYPG